MQPTSLFFDFRTVTTQRQLKSPAAVGGPFEFLTFSTDQALTNASHIGKTLCLNCTSDKGYKTLTMPDATTVLPGTNKIGLINLSQVHIYVRDYAGNLLIVLAPMGVQQKTGQNTTNFFGSRRNLYPWVRLHLIDNQTTAGEWLAEGEGTVHCPVLLSNEIYDYQLTQAQGAPINFQIANAILSVADDDGDTIRWLMTYSNTADNSYIYGRFVKYQRTTKTMSFGTLQYLLRSENTFTYASVALSGTLGVLGKIDNSIAAPNTRKYYYPLTFSGDAISIGTEMFDALAGCTSSALKLFKYTSTSAMSTHDNTSSTPSLTRDLRAVTLSHSGSAISVADFGGVFFAPDAYWNISTNTITEIRSNHVGTSWGWWVSNDDGKLVQTSVTQSNSSYSNDDRLYYSSGFQSSAWVTRYRSYSASGCSQFQRLEHNIRANKLSSWRDLSVVGWTKNNTTISTAPEMITNGGFGADVSWDKETGWTISGGTANRDNTAGFTSISQTIPSLDLNEIYSIKYSVTLSSSRQETYLHNTATANSNQLPVIHNSQTRAVHTGFRPTSDKIVRFRGANTFATPINIDNVSMTLANPDGSQVTFVKDQNNNSLHQIYQAATLDTTKVHSASVYVRAAGITTCRLRLVETTNFLQADFNLTTGTVTASTFGGTAGNFTCGIAPAPHGRNWYQIWVSGKLNNGTTSVTHELTLGTGAYLGTGNNGLYVWRPWVEQAATPLPWDRNGIGAPEIFMLDPRRDEYRVVRFVQGYTGNSVEDNADGYVEDVARWVRDANSYVTSGPIAIVDDGSYNVMCLNGFYVWGGNLLGEKRRNHPSIMANPVSRTAISYMPLSGSNLVLCHYTTFNRDVGEANSHLGFNDTNRRAFSVWEMPKLRV